MSPPLALRSTPSIEAARRWRSAGVGSIAIAIDPPKDPGALRAIPSAAVPVAVATREVGLSYAILNRHLFMNRQDLRLPTCLLLDAGGNVVRVYRDGVDVAHIVKDASAIDATPAERLARAMPFPGTFYSGLPLRNYLPYGRELLDQGLDAAAVVAFDRAAQANPGASTLYRLGTLLTRRPARQPAPGRRSSGRSPFSLTWPRPTTISARSSRRMGISTRRSAGSARRWRPCPTIPTR